MKKRRAIPLRHSRRDALGRCAAVVALPGLRRRQGRFRDGRGLRVELRLSAALTRWPCFPAARSRCPRPPGAARRPRPGSRPVVEQAPRSADPAAIAVHGERPIQVGVLVEPFASSCASACASPRARPRAARRSPAPPTASSTLYSRNSRCCVPEPGEHAQLFAQGLEAVDRLAVALARARSSVFDACGRIEADLASAAAAPASGRQTRAGSDRAARDRRPAPARVSRICVGLRCRVCPASGPAGSRPSSACLLRLRRIEIVHVDFHEQHFGVLIGRVHRRAAAAPTAQKCTEPSR